MADTNKVDVMENLFKSIDVIIGQRLNNLGYDKTIKATIVDDSKAEFGEYICSEDAMSSPFKAYSSDATYTKDMNVYVVVPQGDPNNQRLIVGKCSAAGDAYYNYANPSEDFLDITHNLIKSVDSGDILANNPKEQYIRLWSCDGVEYKGYNRLALKGNFKTWLSDLDAVGGSYGLVLYVVSQETNYNGNKFERTHKFSLLSSEMYGNPFNFETYYLQEKIFDISDLDNIVSMELLLVQNSDFHNIDGELVPYQDKNNRLLPNNIFVQTPYISLGYDLNDTIKDEVRLYTFDSETYDATYDTDSIEKTMEVRWVHIQEDGSIVAIDKIEEIPANTQIHWYKYVLDNTVCDKMAGTMWAEIPEARNTFSYSFVPDILVGTERFKVIIESPSRESISNTISLPNLSVQISDDPKTGAQRTVSSVLNQALHSYFDNSLLSFQEYKQILVEENDKYRATHAQQDISWWPAANAALDEISRAQSQVKIYRSETLTFTNESYDPVNASIDLISGLEILVDAAGYDGAYLLYSDSGMITNPAEATKKRYLTTSYKSLITGEQLLDKAEKVIWYFPLDNTMIAPPVINIEYTSYEIYSELTADELKKLELPCRYARIERAVPEGLESMPGDEIAKQTEQVFRIKDYFTQTSTNNTIYCTVLKNGREYKANVTLKFGVSGTNGTDATFALQMYEMDGNKVTNTPATALTLGSKIAIIPKFYDYDNKDITDTYIKSDSNLNGKTISYSWYSSNTNNGITLIPPGDANNQFAILSIAPGTTLDKCEYYILQAQIFWSIVKYEKDDDGKVVMDENGQPKLAEDKNGNLESRDIQLKTFLPIPVRTDKQYTQVIGPTQIIYDKDGTNPTYYKQPFTLYKNGLECEANWMSACREYINSNPKDTRILNYYPALDVDGNLTPLTMYVPSSGVTNRENNPYAVEALVHGQLVWTQPILIIQNRYSSAMLNAWDGSLSIDKENGTIMSTMVGAGKKDVNNTFSGVLMGDVQAGAGFKAQNKSGLGIYGFHQGDQSFAFNVDGTGFIGKAGRGRINFNGNSGIIESGAYVKNSAGMQIDLDGTDSKSSSLFAYGAGGSFELNTTANTPLLQIKAGPGKNDKKLFYIGSSGGENRDFYLQSENYSSGIDGTKIDLKTGKLELYNKGTGDNASSYIRIDGGGNPYFQIHDGSSGKDIFYAAHNAYRLESTNFVSGSRGVKIDLYNGSLEARSGIIGGWTINATTLTAESMTINSNGSISGGTTYPWSITNEGVASFKYMTAADGGKIGPFTFDADSLYIGAKGLGTSTVYLGTAGVSVGGSAFTANSSNGDIHVAGNIYIGGQIIGNNWGVGGGGGSNPSGFTGGNSGGISASFGNINAAAGHFGPWHIDDSGIYSEDEASRLNPNGKIQLTSNGMTLSLTDSMFYVGAKGTTPSGGSIIRAMTYSQNGFYASTSGGVLAVGNYAGNFAEGGSSVPSVYVTNTAVRMGNANGSVTLSNTGAFMSASGHGYMEIRSTGIQLLAGEGGSGGKIQVSAGSIFLTTTGNRGGGNTSFEVTADALKVDDKASTSNDTYVKIGGVLGAKKQLHFYKGVLMADSTANGDSGSADLFGELAFLDEVVISSASFKIGSSALTITNKTVDKATATFTVTVPGQSYSAGSTGTAHAYAWVDSKNKLHVLCTTGSAPSEYKSTSNKATAYDYTTAGSGGSGTTKARTLTATVTVKAQKKA